MLCLDFTRSLAKIGSGCVVNRLAAFCLRRMRQFFPFFLFLAIVMVFAVSAQADESASAPSSDSPVDLQADSLTHDETGQIITASGKVVLIQDGRKVEADEIVYNLKEDTVVATGHVVYTDAEGNVHYADRATFNDALKKGFVNGLQSFLTDGSRFTASRGERRDGVSTTMHGATYTPCEVCRDDPDDKPLWQIRASEVEHDEANKRVTYRNARFELEGVPVLYVPYFAHPDGSVKRKSGFLTPSAGYKSDLGAFVESNYYWDIAPDKDMTVGMRAMTQEAPLALAQYRQRWGDASVQLDGSGTWSARTDSVGGQKVAIDEEFRGHIKAGGLWDMNEKWRSGFLAHLTTDDQYLRQYDFDEGDVLKNEVFAERFSGRHYGVGRFIAYQDLRIEEEQSDQPNVLPEIQTRFVGEPGSVPVLGGRWSVEASALGVRREGEGQDLSRTGLALGWNRRMVSDYGLVAVLDGEARGEYYRTSDRDGAELDPSLRDDSWEDRTFASMNALVSYPVVRDAGAVQMTIEPLMSLTAAPDIGVENNIPNEDSQDVQIDASNLFEANRFPGLDRIEDETHMTYGMRTGLYGKGGSYGEVFAGQSYRFDDKNNPFSAGSGLDEQESDVVGQIRGAYEGDYMLDYRFQLDNDSLASRRHEVDASLTVEGVSFGTQYLFAKALEGTDITETREQITNSASYYINDRWRLHGGARHDLGSDPGLRQANLGVDYFGQCFSVSMIGQRNLTDEASGDSSTEVFFRIGLKNLGEFQTSGVNLGASGQ